MPFRPTPHPVFRLPSPSQAARLGSQLTIERMAKREEIIKAERSDAYGHGWEPPIWKVCDCLLGFDWIDPVIADKVRHRLGFKRAVSVLLINGGNRGGKTHYASKRTMRVLRRKPEARAWCLHLTQEMSVEYQQALIYSYFPPQWKKDIRTKTTYIAHKQKTGFSENKFVLPAAPGCNIGSECIFKTYEQDITTIEGGNLDLWWCDELVPSDWVETLELRLAERNGKGIITFTPIQGYSPTVKLFCDGAATALDTDAWLLPLDGGPALVSRQLGLSHEEFDELYAAEEQKRASYAPQSIPEWSPRAEGETWDSVFLAGHTTEPFPKEPREFERVPRILRCFNRGDERGQRAVAYFHSSDNPFGNPKNIWTTISSKSREWQRERFYGVAHKLMSNRFPKFSDAVHVLAPELIPTGGTRYHYVDPAGRNYFMLWILCTPEADYVYREWPGDDYIPGIGVPGPWAEPDGAKPDGRPGPAQKSFGWGLLAYKREIARLEGWKDWLPDSEQPIDMPASEWGEAWDQLNGANETVHRRFIDSRWAGNPKQEKERPVTVLEDYISINLPFEPTCGGEGRESINEGVLLINSALDYNELAEVDYHNRPRLFISSACQNLIFALSTWTGRTETGQTNMTGATKDPIDCLRYHYLAGCSFVDDKEPVTSGGGYYR